MQDLVKQFHEDESGATTTEYVILLVVLAIGLIAVIQAFGGKVANLFNTATNSLNNQSGTSY